MSWVQRPLAICACLCLAALILPGVLGAQSPESPRSLLSDATTNLRSAIERYDEDDIAAAADQIRRVIALNPRFGAAHVRLGEALLWLGDYPGAEQALGEARSLRYRGPDLTLLEARLAVLTGDLASARRRYDELLAEQPYNESARVGRAVLRLADGATDAVVRDLQDLTRRYPENRQLLAALMRIMLERDDTERLQEYVDLSLAYHGDSASIQLLAADYAFRTEDYSRAAFHARNSITLAPTLTEAWLILAQTAIHRGDLEQARAHYEELLRIVPDDHEAWYARGELLARAERIEEAEQSWNRALEIRPDFELARVALEHTALDELEMDDPLRGRLAEDYRGSGAALQDRFLSRQAERHFRRGLQLNPFDPVLRAAIAELYLQRGWEARYLAELEVIRERNLTSDEEGALSEQELQDRLEIYQARLQSAPATVWNVDQFTVSRPRTSISVVARPDGPRTLPGADRHIGAYIASLLQGSQQIDITAVESTNDTVSSVLPQARRAGAELLAVIDVELQDRSVAVRLQLVETESTRARSDHTFRRSGNGRVDSVARAITEEIESRVEPRGEVLQRRFEEVLVSLGRIDGIEPEDTIRFISTPNSRDLGAGEVTEIDDLVAVVRYEPDGIDNLSVGDYALVVPEDEPEDEEEEREDDAEQDTANEADPPQPPEEQTSRFREIVQQLFQVR